jgi:peptidyl-prolyl cis-trans isomerase C
MKSFLITIILILTLPIAFAKKTDPTVATVNGIKIKKSTFDKTYKQRLLFVSNKKVTKKSVLEELINKELGIQKAQKENIIKDPEVLSKVNEILYHAQISKDVAKTLLKIKVTDKEVQSYYKINKEYRTAHILTRLRANPSKDEVAKALEHSISLYNRVIKKPKLFIDIAAKYSQTNVSQVGGDLGFQPPTRYLPEYFAEIKGKTVGSITKPVRTQYGIHIIKILGIKKYEKINKNLYKKIIYDIKRDKIIANYHAGLRKKSKVEIKNEYIK